MGQQQLGNTPPAPRSDGSHNDRIAGSARSCRTPTILRQHEHDQCKHGDERGLEVSLCCLCQDQFVQRQIKNIPAQPLVLFLQTLQFLQLVCAHSTVLLFPAVEGLFSHANLADRIQTRHALACQHLNLPQLNNNLFRLRSRNSRLRFSVFLTIGTDQFKGGGSDNQTVPA